jgi:hypothetical protein
MGVEWSVMVFPFIKVGTSSRVPHDKPHLREIVGGSWGVVLVDSFRQRVICLAEYDNILIARLHT